MGLKKLANKLAEYNERLENGKASQIKPRHVEKILDKLKKKMIELEAEITSATSPDKKARLDRKLGIAQTQVERAEWLLSEVS